MGLSFWGGGEAVPLVFLPPLGAPCKIVFVPMLEDGYESCTKHKDSLKVPPRAGIGLNSEVFKPEQAAE